MGASVAVGVRLLVGVKRLVCVGMEVGVGEPVAIDGGVLVLVEVAVTGAEFVLSRKNPSRLFPANPQALPSKKRAGLKLQALVSPRAAGLHTKTSSAAPAIPLAAKAPEVDR